MPEHKRHRARHLQSVQRIVVLNPKGGSGKTTIAINLASHYAQQGRNPVLMDYDPQGSAARWVRKRQASQPSIQLIAAYEKEARVTRSFQLRLPSESRAVIVDTAAAIDAQEMPELTRAADKIIVPVLPSDIDAHACSRCIANLLLVAKVRRHESRLAIVCNRVRRNTLAYQALQRFLATLDIPIVTTLRDSQNYVRGAETGQGLFEMKNYLVADDLLQWAPLLEWLEQPATARAPAQPAALFA